MHPLTPNRQDILLQIQLNSVKILLLGEKELLVNAAHYLLLSPIKVNAVFSQS